MTTEHSAKSEHMTIMTYKSIYEISIHKSNVSQSFLSMISLSIINHPNFRAHLAQLAYNSTPCNLFS
uniref:Uncharacterized protein n=2 Tax=Anguilla anguilla TaxID=7936 RepID=A0A0E9VQB4_ANGAN